SEASSVLPGDHSANAADTAGSIALGSPSRTTDRLSAASVNRGLFVQAILSGYSLRAQPATQSPIAHAQLRAAASYALAQPLTRFASADAAARSSSGMESGRAISADAALIAPRHGNHAPWRRWPRHTEPSERTG